MKVSFTVVTEFKLEHKQYDLVQYLDENGVPNGTFRPAFGQLVAPPIF